MYGQNSDQAIPQPTPCEKYECVLIDKCKAERLACSSFKYYVRTGRAVVTGIMRGKEYKVLKDISVMPTAEILSEIYNEDDAE